jgi:hypothetical protein
MYHMRYVFTSFKRKEVIVLGHRKEAPDPRSRGNGSDHIVVEGGLFLWGVSNPSKRGNVSDDFISQRYSWDGLVSNPSKRGNVSDSRLFL